MENSSNSNESTNSSNKISSPNLSEKENKEYQRNIFKILSQKSISCTKKTISTTSDFIDCITSNNLQKLRHLSQRGLPDDFPMIRALTYKILLNYLPIESEKWFSTLTKKRQEYNYFKSIFISKLDKELNTKQYTSKSLLEQIIKDIYRTNVNFNFFFQTTNKNQQFSVEQMKNIFNQRKNCVFNDIEKDIYTITSDKKNNETHAEVLTRILYIYSKFTPDISYHQGMNELIAPIYYCFSYDKTYKEENESDIEADTFWVFYNLMEKMKSSFDNGNSHNYIKRKADKLYKIIQFIDVEVFNHFTEIQLKNDYFVFRWFILLFSQEFQMGDLLRIWDIIFSNEDVFYYTYYFALGIVEYKRKNILKSDMINVLTNINNFENVNVEDIIKEIVKAKSKFKNEIKNIIYDNKNYNAENDNNNILKLTKNIHYHNLIV